MAEVCGAVAECVMMCNELSSGHKDAEDGTVNPRRLRGVAASIGLFSLGCCMCGALMGPLLLLVAISAMTDDYSTTADVIGFWGFTVAFFAAGVLGLVGIVYAVMRWRQLKPAVDAFDESLPLKGNGDTPGHTNTIQSEPYTHPGYSNLQSSGLRKLIITPQSLPKHSMFTVVRCEQAGRFPGAGIPGLKRLFAEHAKKRGKGGTLQPTARLAILLQQRSPMPMADCLAELCLGACCEFWPNGLCDNCEGPKSLSEQDKTVLVLVFGGGCLGVIFLIPALYATMTADYNSGLEATYWIMSSIGFFCAAVGLLYAVVVVMRKYSKWKASQSELPESAVIWDESMSGFNPTAGVEGVIAYAPSTPGRDSDPPTLGSGGTDLQVTLQATV